MERNMTIKGGSLAIEKLKDKVGRKSPMMMERNWHKCSVVGHFDTKIDCLYEERLVDLPPPRQVLNRNNDVWYTNLIARTWRAM